MARAPFQVLVFPFKKINGKILYAVFSRRNNFINRTQSDSLGNYENAYGLLPYGSNKIALWELNQRLLGLGPRDV